MLNLNKNIDSLKKSFQKNDSIKYFEIFEYGFVM